MAQQIFHPGRNVFVVNDSPGGPYSAFFDDDGETGCFYAVDLTADNLILDVLPVYDVRSAPDRLRRASFSIVWSPDGQQCALLINGNPHAVFDFAAHRGYSRAPMPRTFKQKRGIWPSTDHAWSDDAVAWLGIRKSA